MLKDAKGVFAGVIYCHMAREVLRVESFDPREICPGCQHPLPFARTEIFYVSSLEKLGKVIAKMYEMEGLPVPEKFAMGYITAQLSSIPEPTRQEAEAAY